jgi:cytochrome bd-type quinol oxidase subunit 2
VECFVQPYDAVHHADRHLIFLPMVLAYTAWVMKMLGGRITWAMSTNPDFY